MARPPTESGDTLLHHHTEAIMELSEAINEVQKIMDSRTQNPTTLARALKRMQLAAAKARAHIQTAEAIRKQESPRSIAAKMREAEKRESE